MTTQLEAVRFIVLGCATLLLAACAPVQVKKELGQVNFVYDPGPEAKKTGKSIAIVSPVFAGVQDDPRLAVLTARAGTENTYNVSFIRMFDTGYKNRVAQAMRDTTLEIFTRRGFTTMGPYATFDDMTYTDKKAAYLASVPTLNFVIDEKRTKEGCVGALCTVEGVIQITGDMNYKMVEPLTGQAVVNRRINLSDFQISKNYIKQFTPQAGAGSLGAVMVQGLSNAVSNAQAGSSGMQPVDDSDKVLAEALNEFYSKAMTRIDSFISQEELMALRKEVDTLKATKRY